jgi:hypothetical protein
MREKLELNSEIAKVPAALPVPPASPAGRLMKLELVKVLLGAAHRWHPL